MFTSRQQQRGMREKVTRGVQLGVLRCFVDDAIGAFTDFFEFLISVGHDVFECAVKERGR